MAVIVGPTLPEPHFDRVESVWATLADRFDVDRYVNPYPHVTLYGLEESVDVDAVVAAAERVAAAHDPFTVRTSGLGIFPGAHVYVPVAKSPAMLDLHRDAVDALAPLGRAPTDYYEPDGWFPHVGLALALDPERAGEVAGALLDDAAFDWTFTVDNVSITRPAATGTEYELVASVDL
jgi:2'-5' RNA ligase